MPDKINLKSISIVLHRTRSPENIGAAARAIRNMGIGQLVVVDPQNCDLTKICRMATHAASDVVEQMAVCDTLDEARPILISWSVPPPGWVVNARL